MSVFADFIDDIMEVFMDDFSVCRQSFEGCLSNLEMVLERCVKVNLVLNWEKAISWSDKESYLDMLYTNEELKWIKQK